MFSLNQSGMYYRSRAAFATLALTGTIAAGLLTGCGAGIAAGPSIPADTIIPSFSGIVHGGPNPVIGATVTLYIAGTGASPTYGSAPTAVAADTQTVPTGYPAGNTDVHGDFSFTTNAGYTCPNGDFVYIVASGGNTGAGGGPTYPANNASTLVAALGPCSSLIDGTSGDYDGPSVYINEVTTAAAAYALGQFSSVSGTGPYTVYINAPANNNASMGSTTAAAGLAHAFLNAANLANPFNSAVVSSGANTTTVTPNYSSTAPTATAGIVPQALINSIANAVVACVNSTGASSNACTQEFSDVGGSPTNTFSALVNLAANPTCSGSPATCQDFLNQAQSITSTYFPDLTSTSTVNDLSIGITYPGGNSTNGASTIPDMAFPQAGVLDMNDYLYIGSVYNAAVATKAATPVAIFSLSSNGELIGNNTSSASWEYTFGLSMDALGNGYFGNGSKSGSTALGSFTTSSGLPSAFATTAAEIELNDTIAGTGHSGVLKIYSIAVDASNNLWAFGVYNGTSSLFDLIECASNGSPTGVLATTTAKTCVPQSPLNSSTAPTVSTGTSGAVLALDPYQNVWVIDGNAINVLANTGTVTSPTYPDDTVALVTATATTNPTLGLAFTPVGGSACGGSGSTYCPFISGTTGLQPISYTLTSDQIDTIAAGTNFGTSTVSASFATQSDGLGTLWTAGENTATVDSVPVTTPAIVQTLNPLGATPASYLIEPCAASSTTCATSIFSTKNQPISIAIDSAGSIWTVAPSNSTAVNPVVVQIIGSAAPTWPLLSLGKTGEPQ